ncbi:hypothetical protein BN12_70015 [Nostocoides japonicum T1-X7]|uniref:Uncharacterized protein n=1 Tax=Nostocoides japonicum T1-X7 TaxID=1194083 RepID=A0A077M770_9MICO|nr:hypothetical protein BN12_70015 [Tetrasphaera japonica T1-X7]
MWTSAMNTRVPVCKRFQEQFALEARDATVRWVMTRMSGKGRRRCGSRRNHRLSAGRR